MAPSFFSRFGSGRRGDRQEADETASTPDRPARPRPTTRVPRLDVPDDEEPTPAPEFAPDADGSAPSDGEGEAATPAPRGTSRRGSMTFRMPGDDAAAVPGDGEPDAPAPGEAAGEPGAADPATREREAQDARIATVQAAADGWRDELLALGSASTLADLTLLGDAVLDLSHAHPGGIAGLYAGRRTQLRNLIREPQALEHARYSSRVVLAAATELTHRFGLAPTFLAVGVATWALAPGHAMPGVASGDHMGRRRPADPATALAAQLTLADLAPQLGAGHGAGDVRSLGRHHGSEGHAVLRVPVLLRPVRITPREDGTGDVDLQLERSVEINPVLVSALREAGVDVDVAAVVRAGVGGAGFAPREALLRLNDLAQVLPGFELDEAIVVGTFLDPGQVVLDDLAAVRYRLPDSDVLAAVAGDAPARAALAAQEFPPAVAGDRDPDAERGIGDLDAGEQHALDVVAAGRSVLLDAPVGSHPDRLAAAILADAAASGRRTLYVPATKRLGRATLDRLTKAGLEDVVLQLEADPGWQASAADQLRRSVAAREVDLDVELLRTRRDELGDVHGRLSRYIGRLHDERTPWGVSVHRVMQQLARLSAAGPPPLTSVRLPAEVLRDLAATGMDDARGRLQRAATLGAFSVGPGDTPWYGARVRTEDEAAAALTRAGRLAEETLPRLQAQVTDAAAQSGLSPAPDLAAWAEQLHVLDDVAESLDLFLPQVYERPVDDLVVATAPRAWRREREETMSSTERRDLRRTAAELVRPGRSAGDLHTELLKVQAQRLAWERHAPNGGWPRLPEGLAAMRATEREVRADLDALTDVLAPSDVPLSRVPLAELRERMAALSGDAAALRDVPARSSLLEELRERGLGELLDDLAARRVTASMVGPELDLAWWSGVFQDIVSTDPALAGYDGPALGMLAARFRDLDAAQCAGLPGPVRHAVVERSRERVYADTDAAAELYHSLGSDGGGHLRATFARMPDLTWELRPVRAVAPMLVPQVLAASTDIDLLVLDHPGRLGMAQLAGALGRAMQVVVLADVRAGSGGAAEELGAVLPGLTLGTGRTDVAPDVMGFLAAHGYADVATVLPQPPAGPRVRLEVVTGEGTTGTPAPGGDAVESPPAEVARVVELVEEHAATRPETSLGVVALTERHAAAIRRGLRERARGSDALHRFLTAGRHENVVAIGAADAAGLHRDRIILTIGFGKTVHGRVLHQFGPVSEPGGRAVLVDALGAVRRELDVVSCLAPGEILSSRVNSAGTQLLGDLLVAADSGSLLPGGDPLRTEQLPLDPGDRGADQLLVDLTERLWALGLRVVRDFTVPGFEGSGAGVSAPTIALAVGHPDLPDELLVAVLTDDARYVAQPSLRTRDRHEVETLEQRGWTVYRVFSAAMFLDLQREARAIADVVARAAAERRSGRSGGDAGEAEGDARRGGGAPSGGNGASGESGRKRDSDASEEPGGLRDSGETGETDGSGQSAPARAAVSPARAVADRVRRGFGGSRGGGRDATPDRTERTEGKARPESKARPDRPTPMPRGPRPDVAKGLGLANYSDEDLDTMVAWIVADALPRTEGQLVTELRAHLDIRDTGAAARAVLARAARRRTP